MFITIKAKDNDSLMTLFKELKSYSQLSSNNQYIYATVNFKGNKVIFYTNNTITIEGNYLDLELKEIFERTILDKELYIGNDEVGTGEGLGPIVVCSISFKNLEQKSKFFFSGIVDSKKLNYKKIMSLGKQLEKEVIYKCVTLSPKNLNTKLEEGANIKQLLAIMHNDTIASMKNNNRQIIIDEFVNKNKYFQYLKESPNINEFETNIIFATKAEEKYIEVAAAAILAKYIFNKYLEKRLNESNISIDKYVKNSINYNEIISDINKKNITIKGDDLLKKWK